MACRYHRNREETHRCGRCGCSLCGECKTSIENVTFCPHCLREEVVAEQHEALEVKKRIKRELIFILLGLLFGIAIVFSMSDGFKEMDNPLYFIAPFVFASLIAIVRRIGRVTASVASDRRNWNFGGLIFMLIFIGVVIIASPIIFVYRVFTRIRDYRNMSKIYNGDEELLRSIDAYVSHAETSPRDGEPSLSLSGEDEEFVVNFERQANNFMVNNNGEVIRDARYR